MGFRDQGIEPAHGFKGDGFTVRPLTPSDVVLDYDAVMSSREFLFHWEQDPPYPSEDFSVEDNLKDLERMYSAHRDASRYTYTVMNAAETEALGCIYLLPNDDRMYDTAEVTSHDGTDLSTVDATSQLLGPPIYLGERIRARRARRSTRLAAPRLVAHTAGDHHERAPPSPDRND